MDIKAALMISGLSIHFISSFFLALYILGEERIRRIENWITQEFSIFTILNTIKGDFLRFRIMGGISTIIWPEMLVERKRRLLYHCLPRVLITLVSIWIIAFYGFQLSFINAFMGSIFLTILSFSQGFYNGFLIFLQWKFCGFFYVINLLAGRSLLIYKTWWKLTECQMRFEAKHMTQMSDDERIAMRDYNRELLKDALTESQIDYLLDPKPLSLGHDILLFLTLSTMYLFSYFILFVTALLFIPPYLWTCVVLNFPKFIISKGLKYSSLWKVPFIGLIGIFLLTLGFFLQLLAFLVS